MVCCRCCFPGQQLGPSLKHLFHRLQSPTQVPVLWRVFGWSHQAEHRCLLLIAASLLVSAAEAGLRPCPPCLLGLKAQGQGFLLVTLKVFWGGGSPSSPPCSLQCGLYPITATAAASQRSSPCQERVSPPQLAPAVWTPLEKRSPRAKPLLAHGHLLRAA